MSHPAHPNCLQSCIHSTPNPTPSRKSASSKEGHDLYCLWPCGPGSVHSHTLSLTILVPGASQGLGESGVNGCEGASWGLSFPLSPPPPWSSLRPSLTPIT